MKKILVPTDFSVNAMKAALYAVSIAEKNGAEIYLLHIIEPISNDVRQPYTLHIRLEEQIEKNRLKELQALKKTITHKYPGIGIKTQMIIGTVASTLVNFAQTIQADLIVMGTKGATGLKEIFIGSIAAGTIGKTKIPVLAVPDKYVFKMPDAVLFMTNHYELNKEMVAKIVDMAQLFDATVYVAVFMDSDTSHEADYLHNTQNLEGYLYFLKSSFPGVSFKGEVLYGEEFEEAVENYEIKNEVDIIAMVTYPKTLWERLTNRSVTKKMAFHSKIPVLALPALYW